MGRCSAHRNMAHGGGMCSVLPYGAPTLHVPGAYAAVRAARVEDALAGVHGHALHAGQAAPVTYPRAGPGGAA